jgi:hypothetical protein
MTPHLAERWCGQAARRDDARVARRLDRTPVVDGVYRLDEGAWRENCFACLPARGVVDRLGDVQGTAVQRARVPCVQDLLCERLKTLVGIACMHALPALLGRAVARMRRVGFKAHQVWHGVCQRGAAPRQGPRRTGPIGPDALAATLVKRNVRDLEALVNGASRALAKAGVCAAQVTGLVAATALATTAPSKGCGHAPRPRKGTDTRGQGHEIAGTVYGGQRPTGDRGGRHHRADHG